MIEACAQLPVELEIVEGVPHDEARERYARADIVVDQLNAGWHGVFALEAMALGKPVVAHLKPDVVERSAEGFGVRVPIVPATKDTLADALRPLVEDAALRRELGAASRAYVEQVHDIDRVADRLIDIYARSVGGARRAELKRLGTQSAIYGLGGMISRLIAVFLLPVYTVYLGPVGFGKIETIIALTSVLVIVLRLGITSAFFRFYFDSDDEAHRTLVVRTSFWFTMGMATLGLASASPLADADLARGCTSTTRGSSAPASSGSGRR